MENAAEDYEGKTFLSKEEEDYDFENTYIVKVRAEEEFNNASENRHKLPKKYALLDNRCFNNDDISYGAKGLYALLCSIDTDEIAFSEIMKFTSVETEDEIREILKEIEHFGFLSWRIV